MIFYNFLFTFAIKLELNKKLLNCSMFSTIINKKNILILI